MTDEVRSNTPTAVKLDVAGNLLQITWSDAHVSRYDGGYLRFLCPCAACRGHSPGQVEPPLWESVKDVRLSHVAPVGSYALSFTVSDGHSSGIYSYGFLRDHCPSTRVDLDDCGRPIS